MSPLQQALALMSAAFLLGIAMIVGGLALRPDMPVHIVMAPHASTTTDSMGVSGVGYDDQGDQMRGRNSRPDVLQLEPSSCSDEAMDLYNYAL